MIDFSNANSLLNNILDSVSKEQEVAFKIVLDAIKKSNNIDGVLYPKSDLDYKDSLQKISEIYPNFQNTLIEALKTNETTITPSENIAITISDLNDLEHNCNTPTIIPHFNTSDVLNNICPPISENTKQTNIPNVSFDNKIQQQSNGFENLSVEESIKTLNAFADNPDLETPNLTLVISNVEGLVSISSELASTFSCGDVIMKIGDVSFSFPYGKGVIKKILVKDGDFVKKKTKLFLAESTVPQKQTSGIIHKVAEISQDVISLNILKTQLSEIEVSLFNTLLIMSFYQGRYEGYVHYYNTFKDKIKQRNELNILAQDKITQFNAFLPTSNDKEDVVTEKISQRERLASEIQNIVNQINQTTTEIDIIRGEQPTYFALSGTPQEEAKLNLGDRKEFTFAGKTLIDQSYSLVPFTPAEKQSDVDAPTLHKELYNKFKEFTNQLLLNGLGEDSTFDSVDFSFNITEANLTNANITDVRQPPTVLTTNGYYALNGTVWSIKKDYMDSIFSTTDFIKNTEDIEFIQNSMDALKIQENTLPSKIFDSASKTSISVREFSKNYGYAAINKEAAFLRLDSTDLTSLFLSDLNSNVEKYNKLLNEYNEIITKINETNAKIENFNSFLNDQNSCVLKNIILTPSVLNIDGKNENVSILNYPVELRDGVLDENIEFRENPHEIDVSPNLTDMRYWKKFCNLASVVNILPIYWPIGIVIPSPNGIIKIPMPIIWKPVIVISTPTFIMVIGIAQCGVIPGPFIFFLNPSGHPFGNIPFGSSMFVGAIRPMKEIDSDTNSKVINAIPVVEIPIKDENRNVQKIKVNVSPEITRLLPFGQDDLPPWERLSLKNLLFLLYLDKWCKAGKISQGFFKE